MGQCLLPIMNQLKTQAQNAPSPTMSLVLVTHPATRIQSRSPRPLQETLAWSGKCHEKWTAAAGIISMVPKGTAALPECHPKLSPGVHRTTRQSLSMPFVAQVARKMNPLLSYPQSYWTSNQLLFIFLSLLSAGPCTSLPC